MSKMHKQMVDTRFVHLTRHNLRAHVILGLFLKNMPKQKKDQLDEDTRHLVDGLSPAIPGEVFEDLRKKGLLDEQGLLTDKGMEFAINISNTAPNLNRLSISKVINKLEASNPKLNWVFGLWIQLSKLMVKLYKKRPDLYWNAKMRSTADTVLDLVDDFLAVQNDKAKKLGHKMEPQPNEIEEADEMVKVDANLDAGHNG
jgi:hypothetical protein